MTTALQGVIAAGTVGYLTREPSWEKVFIAANHFFYLVGIEQLYSGRQGFGIPQISKGVFVISPLFLLGGILVDYSNTSNQEATRRDYALYAYQFIAVISTVVLLALGSKTYAMAFFAVTGLDFFTRREDIHQLVKTLFSKMASVAAFVSFASYGVKLISPTGKFLFFVLSAYVLFTRTFMFVEWQTRGYRLYDVSRSRFYSSFSASNSVEEPKKEEDTPPSKLRTFLESCTGPLPHNL